MQIFTWSIGCKHWARDMKWSAALPIRDSVGGRDGVGIWTQRGAEIGGEKRFLAFLGDLSLLSQHFFSLKGFRVK